MIKKLLGTLQRIALHILDFFCVFFFRLTNKFIFLGNKAPSEHLNDAVYIKLDALGDFVLWLSSLPEKNIDNLSIKTTLIIDEKWAPLANALNIVDELVLVNTQAFNKFSFYRFSKLRELSNIRCHIAFQCVYSRRSIMCDSVMLMLSAEQKVTFPRDYKNNRVTKIEGNILDRIYTEIVPLPSSDVNEVNLYRHLIMKKFKRAKYYVPNFDILPSYFEPKPKKGYIVIAPFAGWSRREWPMERYLQIIEWMFELGSYEIILVGTPSDREGIEKIPIKYKSMFTDLVGKTSIIKYISIIRDAKLILCNDSSAAHIALVTNTKMVCVLGGGHFGRFLPRDIGNEKTVMYCFEKMPCFGCNWKCHFELSNDEAVPCISAIKMNEVKIAINRMIGI